MYSENRVLFSDIIGICQHANDIQNLVARTTRRDLKKRDITLVDQSDASVSEMKKLFSSNVSVSRRLV